MEEHGGPTRVSDRDSERAGHSRLGIASFIIAILATVIIIVGVIVAASFGAQVVGSDPQSVTPQDLEQNLRDSPGATAALGVAGVSFVVAPLLYLLGLALGVAGLIQRRRRKLFSWLGTVLNVLPLLVIVGLFVLSAVLAPAV